jgi:hypothetical protein
MTPLWHALRSQIVVNLLLNLWIYEMWEVSLWYVFSKFKYLHSGVNDSAVHITVESMTPLKFFKIFIFAHWSQWLRCARHSVVNDSTVHVTAKSLTPLWQNSAITKSIFSANTDPYWKRLWPVSQGPRGSCLVKKTRGRKSRFRVPLNQGPRTDVLMKKKSRIENLCHCPFYLDYPGVEPSWDVGTIIFSGDESLLYRIFILPSFFIHFCIGTGTCMLAICCRQIFYVTGMLYGPLLITGIYFFFTG